MGLFGKLFGKTQASSGEPQMTIPRAWDIAGTYGEFMEKSDLTPGTVADVNELPFPKEVIKHALRVLLVYSKDSNMREALKLGYCELANYQPGVGPVRVGPDLLKMDLSDSLRSAQQVLAESKAAEKWLAASSAEFNTLLAELKNLDLLRNKLSQAD